MKINLFIAELQKQGITLSRSGDDLKLKALNKVPSQVIETIKANKVQILRFLDDKDGQKKTIQPLTPERRSAGQRVSFRQRVIWYIAQEDTSSSHYNVLLPLMLSGQLDVPALCAALKQVYLRHESLHCLFRQDGEHIVMYPAPSDAWAVTCSQGEEADVSTCLTRERHWQFDLSQGPLFRAHLLSLPQQRHLLLLNLPHIVIDGWSMEHLWREVVALYQGQPLAPVTIDFLDYLAHPVPTHEEHWEQRLKHYTPFELHSSGIQDNDEFIWQSQLTDHQVQQLEQLARQQNVSCFTATLALFGQLIGQYVNQDDIVISTPYAHRDNPAISHILGYMVSMLPVRLSVSHNALSPQIPTLEQRIHQDMKAAETDFHSLASKAGWQSAQGHHPLQQVVFAWQEGLLTPASLPGVSVEPLGQNQAAPKFPLMLSVRPEKGNYHLKWEFTPSVISLADVKLLAKRFAQLINVAGDLSALPQTQTPQHFPLPDKLIRRFSDMAARYPDKDAVISQHQKCTYAVLNTAADSVAACLQQYGVQPGERIGLYLPVGIDFTAAILGIAKAGAVYVPLSLDVINSGEWLTTLIQQCQMRLCLTSDDISLPALHMLSIEEALNTQATQYREPQLPADAPLYVNFSSGTTGQPKGIECTCLGVMRLVLQADYINIDEHLRMLCAAPATFDAFTLEFWAPLLNGGVVCFANSAPLTPTVLRDMVQQQHINTAWLTASLFNTLTDIDVQAFCGLKQLLVGGDVVSPAHIAKVYNADPDIQVINGYGPTENTTFTCCYPIPRNWPLHLPLPIGQAIAGTDVFILSHTQQLQPTGCLGEIATSGNGLAVGYLQPQAGDTPFVPAHNTLWGPRFYKTGDLGFIDSLGRVHFIGRADKQVKIRGLRIEPDAVSRLLNRHNNVQYAETLVVNQGEQAQLISFVQHSIGVHSDEAQLLKYLAEQLPAWMLPNTIITVGSMPLTQNGKLDRKALELCYHQHHQQQNAIRPLTEIEQQVADIWAEVLQCDVQTLHTDSHFFKLGGNSLSLLQVQNKLQEKTGKKLIYSNISKNILLKNLAQTLSSQNLSEISNEESSLEKRDTFPLTNEQMRLWWLQLKNNNDAYNIPLVLTLKRRIANAKITSAIRNVAHNYPMLRIRFVEANGTIFQKLYPAAEVPISLVQINEGLLTQFIEKFAKKTLNIDEYGTEFALFNDPSGKQTLMLNTHHSCFDGSSLPILLRALEDSLNDKPLKQDEAFLRFAIWQQSKEFAEQTKVSLQFWKHQLSGIKIKTSLPSDVNKTLLNTTGTHRIKYQPPLELLKSSKSITRHSGITEFSFWYAIISFVFAKLLNNNKPVIAVPAANRHLPQHHQSIGFYANTLLMAAQIDEESDVLSYLISTQEVVMASINHQAVPLSELNSFIETGDDTTDIMFIMTLDDSNKQSDLFDAEIFHPEHCKFNLTFEITQTEESLIWSLVAPKNRYSLNLLTYLMETTERVADQICSKVTSPLSSIVLFEN